MDNLDNLCAARLRRRELRCDAITNCGLTAAEQEELNQLDDLIADALFHADIAGIRPCRQDFIH